MYRRASRGGRGREEDGEAERVRETQIEEGLERQIEGGRERERERESKRQRGRKEKTEGVKETQIEEGSGLLHSSWHSLSIGGDLSAHCCDLKKVSRYQPLSSYNGKGKGGSQGKA